MKKRYNIALRPINQVHQFIEFARNFAFLADSYLLGKKSFPHLTLCQFFVEEMDLARIWRQVNDALDSRLIFLSFSRYSFITAKSYYWVSLIPDYCDVLFKMHYAVANIIRDPINRSFEQYDPHITLINTKAEDYEEKVKQNIPVPPLLADTFILSLGKSDDVGQFVEVIQ